MTYRLLLDENVEHGVKHRLENYGHDVVHVDFVPALGKGTMDREIAEYSLETDRLILTYDDDFVLDIDPDSNRGVLYVSDRAMPATDVADVVHAMSQYYPQIEVTGIERVDPDWL